MHWVEIDHVNPPHLRAPLTWRRPRHRSDPLDYLMPLALIAVTIPLLLGHWWPAAVFFGLLFFSTDPLTFTLGAVIGFMLTHML